MRHVRRISTLSVVGMAILLCIAASGGNAGAAAPDERELLDKYLPVLATPRQKTPCGKGEPFFPVAVDAVLGREEVTLRDARRRALITAPTAQDLAMSGASAYLDFPGKALKPGCAYEKWFDSLDAEPTTYGRLVLDPNHPDRLVAQYWFFWIYNDWNDRHEGDWEMVQFLFDTPDPARAMDEGPSDVIVAQHEGGEVRAWGDMSLWDDQPLFFPAAGSHATYYSAGRWLGTDAQTGFGCDDTGSPLTVIRPELKVLPTRGSIDPESDLAWLAWEGRWGERQPTFNNGPTGPTTKDQWNHPVTWFEEEGRAASVSLPPLGTPVTNTFCAVTARASLAMFELFDRPWLVAIVVVLLGGLIVRSMRKTSWTPNDPFPLSQHRDAGAMWIAAARMLTRKWRRFLPFMALLFVVGAVVRRLQHGIMIMATSSDLASILDERGRLSSTLVTATWLILMIPVTALVLAAIVVIVNEERSLVHRSSPREIIGKAATPSILLPSLGFTVLMLLTVLPLYGLVAVYFAVRWMVAPSLAGEPHPFRKSAELTRRDLLRTFRTGTATLFVSVFLAPVIGTILLVSTTWPLGVLSAITSAVAAFMLPWAMVSMCLLRETLESRG